MKKKLSLLMVALVAVAAFAVQATKRATVEKSYTITFQETGTSDDASVKLTAIADIIASGEDYVSDIPTATNVYKGREGRGIKLGTSKATGTLTLTLAEAVKPTKITFKARKYNDKGEQNIIVNGNSFDELGELAEYTIEYDGNTEVTEIAISTSGESLTGSSGTSNSYRAYITEVSVFYNEEAGDDPQPETKTVTFQNDQNWEKVYVWAWNETENFTGGEWPGEEIIADAVGVYTWSTTGDPTYIIFSNGNGTQTANLDFEDGATYNSQGKVTDDPINPEPVLNTYSVTFTTDVGWEKVYAYVWTDNTPLVEWPGTEITETLTEGVYTYEFQAAEAPTNIIFNNGTGGEGNQTADLAFENGKAYSFTTPKEVSTLDFASLDPTTVNSSLVGSYGNLDNYTIADATQGVKMLIQNNSAQTPCRFWEVDGSLQLRAYTGASFTFEPIEAGKVIKKITFDSSTWGAKNTTDVSALSDNEWTGSAAKVVLTIGAKTFIESIAVEVGEATTPEPTTYTATFTTNLGWEKVYAYTWTGEGEDKVEQLGAWPGTELTATEGVYDLSFETEVAPANIIFNDGTMEGGEVGVNQTADLTFENGKAYELMAVTISTIAEAHAVEAGTEVVIEGVVMASAANGAVIGDDTDVIYYYNTKNALTVGQKVQIKGAVSSYGGANQLTAAAEITDLGTVDGVVYPEAVEMKEDDFTALAEATAVERKYVTYQGTLSISGNYFNITVGDSEVKGSIVKPNEDLSALDGKTVVVKGYQMYITGSNKKYVYTVATSVEEVQAVLQDGYYLVGNMTDWKAKETYDLKDNSYTEGDETVEEYMITFWSYTDYQFKIAKVENGVITAWYPDGEGNAYGENNEIKGEGESTIYFRPAGGVEGWFHGYFNVTGAATGINAVKAETLKNAEMFNLAGQRVQNAQKGLYIVNGKKVVIK